MTRERARDQFRGKYESHYDSYPSFDLWRNIAAAVLIGALKDLDSPSPWYRKQAYIWLNSQDALELCLELGCEDSVRDFLFEKGYVLPILAFESPKFDRIIPIFIRPVDSC